MRLSKKKVSELFNYLIDIQKFVSALKHGTVFEERVRTHGQSKVLPITQLLREGSSSTVYIIPVDDKTFILRLE